MTNKQDENTNQTTKLLTCATKEELETPGKTS